MKNIVIQRKRFALLCMSAALIFASSPSSVFAAEENAQTESAPAGAPSTEAPSVHPSNPNEAPGSASSEASKPDNSGTNSSTNIGNPGQEASSSQAPSTQVPPAQTPATPAPPAETVTPPASSTQPTTPENTNPGSAVTPMQGTFYAATKTGLLSLIHI